jgi:signal transduction histidine kinase
MLRRMKIGGRVNLLIAVPLLTLVAFAAIGYWALQQTSVRGEHYKDLKLAQELRAETLPPPASLLQAWAEVNQIGVLASSDAGFNPTVHAQIDVHFRTIASAEADFKQSMDYWASRVTNQQVKDSLLGNGREAGLAFFQVIDTALKDAVAKNDRSAVLAVISSLEWRYALQQTGAQTALNWAENEVTMHEAETNTLVQRVTVFGGSGAALLLLLTLLLSVRVRRLIVRPIRALSAHAKGVAMHELPNAVASLHELPADAPTPRLPDFELSSTRDELAELADAFNSVQDAAIDLAAEQARTRRVVSENLINIARRNQNLLGRTLGFISSLEQTERDPENLDNLFRIDHLATRMRRNAQSLLVLAGATPTRLYSQPVPVGDVVRAALSEVENYGQVELAELGDAAVTGSASGDVAHLLAELLENATSFSPPTTAVTVVGRAVPDGHQLAVFDYGLGMTPEDMAAANERLNQVTAFDRESSKMLGFQVVARLAARHGIKVMLTTTPGGSGVTAIVRLPRSILETTGSEVAPKVDIAAATARLTESLPVVAPVSVAPVSFETLQPVGSAPAFTPSNGSRPEPAPLAAPASPAPSALAAPPAPLAAPAPTPSAPAVAQPAPAGVDAASPAPTSTFATLAALKPLVTRPRAEPAVEDGGGELTKRVRGAQMPDVGEAAEASTPTRGADDVRSTLTSLQRGIDLGRQHGGEA